MHYYGKAIYIENNSMSYLLSIKEIIDSVIAVFLHTKKPQLVKNSMNAQKDVIVIGNGPSLKDSIRKHRAWFKNKRKICVNRFCLTNLFFIFKPEYYIFMDPAYWRDSNSSKYRKVSKDIYDVLVNKVRWQMTIFFPMEAKNNGILTTVSEKNKHIKMVYVNTTGISGPYIFKHYCYEKNYALPPMQTVVIAALYVAINIGYKKIYLVGADQSWHEDLRIAEGNKIVFGDNHFYKAKKKVLILDRKSKDADQFTMKDFFSVASRVFFGHEEMEKYAEYMNVKIFNASEKSYIDAYNKIIIPHNN